MLYVQSNCRKHSCNLCCNFCRLEFRGILMWMEQHFQIMKSCSPGTRLNTFSHRSRNVARTEWVTWFWLQSILCVALSKFANIGPTCIVHMVSPSEGSLMNVYWLHSWSVSRLAHSGSHLVALQGRGKVFPILVKDGTLYTCTQIVAPSTIKEGSKQCWYLVSGCASSLASYCCCTCAQLHIYLLTIYHIHWYGFGFFTQPNATGEDLWNWKLAFFSPPVDLPPQKCRPPSPDKDSQLQLFIAND